MPDMGVGCSFIFCYTYSDSEKYPQALPVWLKNSSTVKDQLARRRVLPVGRDAGSGQYSRHILGGRRLLTATRLWMSPSQSWALVPLRVGSKPSLNSFGSSRQTSIWRWS